MIIETERLYLLTADEVIPKQVLNYYTVNKNHLRRWEPNREASFYTIEQHTKNLEIDRKNFENKSGIRLFIMLKEFDITDNSVSLLERDIIGFVNFSNIVYGVFLSSFIGYAIGEKYLRKGYMTEAIKLGIDVMFNSYGLHRIEGNVIPRNINSLQLLKKLGFQEEGISPKYLRINGVWEDHFHMVMRNEALE